MVVCVAREAIISVFWLPFNWLLDRLGAFALLPYSCILMLLFVLLYALLPETRHHSAEQVYADLTGTVTGEGRRKISTTASQKLAV